MSSAAASSLFESLPPELFNRVLSYVLEPVVNEEASTKFRGYQFDTAILLVNKAIHALAKGYLHHSISWIRLDLNWDGFLIDPRWLGIPYITLDRVKQPKVLPLVYGGDNKVRSVKQDVPDGRISARISFLLPTTNAQKVMKKACSHSPFGSRMRLLVHENDINRFLVILRMNDLAYCDRLPPVKNEVASLQIAVKQYGISFNIQVTHGYQIAKYKHLIDMFNIRGAWSFRDDKIQLSRRQLDGQLRRVRYVTRTYWEGVTHLLYLKWKGELLRHGHHWNAYMCYTAALEFEPSLIRHLQQPADWLFWWPTEHVYRVFGISIGLNLALAQIVGGLQMPAVRVRRLEVRYWTDMLEEFSDDRRLLQPNQFVEAVAIATLYNIFTTGEKAVVAMIVYLPNFVQAWKDYHQVSYGCERDTILGKIYTLAKAFIDIGSLEDQLPLTPEYMEKFKKLASELKLKPMKWAIQKSIFPEELQPRLAFMSKSIVEEDNLDTARQHFQATFPSINEPSEDSAATGDKGARYLI